MTCPFERRFIWRHLGSTIRCFNAAGVGRRHFVLAMCTIVAICEQNPAALFVVKIGVERLSRALYGVKSTPPIGEVASAGAAFAVAYQSGSATISRRPTRIAYHKLYYVLCR